MGQCWCRRLNIFAVAFGLATFGVAASDSVFAQMLADVEVGGVGVEVHPTYYTYDGDIKPVYKGTTAYYTFFYTGLVEPNATVPLETVIQRIPISNLEWEQNKANMIQKLTNAYANDPNKDAPTAKKSIINRDVRLDKNFKYVDTKASEKKAARAGRKGGVGDPEVAAEWVFYYDQFVLWQYYCRRVLLDQEDAKLASSTAEEIDERKDREFLRKYSKQYDLEGLDVDDIIELVELERDQIEDEENEAEGRGGRRGKGKGKGKGKFGRDSSRDKDGKDKKDKRRKKSSKSKDRGKNSGKGGGAKRSGFGDEEGTVFEAGLDFEDPERLNRYYTEFLYLADRREEFARRIYIAMVNDIEARKSDRVRLADWRSRKANDLGEFVEAWDNVQSGESVAVGDTFFLITDKPVESIPEESRNILVRRVMTPQDLMDENGKLKESEFGQGF